MKSREGWKDAAARRRSIVKSKILLKPVIVFDFSY